MAQQISDAPLPPNMHHQINAQINFQRRNPLLLRIFADDQDKRKTCIFWGVFLVLILIIAIISSVAVPDVFIKYSGLKIKNSNIQSCENPSIIQNNTIGCSDFNVSKKLGMIGQGWKSSNQFAIVSLVIIPDDVKKQINFKSNLSFNLFSYSLLKKTPTIYLKIEQQYGGFDTEYLFQSDKAKKLYAYDSDKIIGFSQSLAIITKLDDVPLFFNIQFKNLLMPTSVNKIFVQAQLINPQYTTYTIVVRYVFFGFSIASLVLYYIRYTKIPQQSKIIEQKLIAIASILLIMFNDPFYPITILKPNGFSAFLSIVFVINLIVFLIFMWIIFADRITFEDGQIATHQITKTKIFVVSMFWIQLLICMMIYTVKQIQTAPILSPSFLRGYQIAKVIIVISVLVLFGYIGYRFGSLCFGEDKLWRSYIFVCFSSIFIFSVMIIILSNTLSPLNYTGQSIVVAYSLINIYIYYLQIMFTITQQQVLKIQGNRPDIIPDNYDIITTGTIDIVQVDITNQQAKRKNNSKGGIQNVSEQQKIQDGQSFKFQD